MTDAPRHDKVLGLMWAVRWHERYVAEGRFDDALQSLTAMGHLMADLREERE